MTTLAPLLAAEPVVQVHALGALIALVLGPFALFRRRRDRWHKGLGYAWISVMAITALSSFGITGMAVVGPFGPIHLLSFLTLGMLVWGLWSAIRRRIEAHRRILHALYFWSLGVAGLFTLLPGRIMHRVLFGEDTWAGFALIAALALLGWWAAKVGARKAKAPRAFPLHTVR